jgi:PST family polysaccharide transporter
MVVSSSLGLAIQIVATVILARLLSPRDFGLITLVTTFSLIFSNFGLNGFTEAIIQREEINTDLITNLFWMSLGIGTFLTAGFAAAGRLMARFYHDPLVAPVAAAISLTIFFTSLSVQHLALLKRAMRFTVVSAIDAVSRIAYVAVSIVGARMGWGYWALVAGVIAQPFCTSLGAWIMCRWAPGLPRKATGTASMARFAINVYGRFTVNYFARNIDNLLVGWRFGANSLGFYKKAYDLFALSANQLTAPLTNVAVSALSRFSPRSSQYRQHLLSSLSVMAFISMGVAANLTLIGKDVIRLALGPRWQQAGSIFTFFGPGIGAMLIYHMHGWIHLSIGKAERWFRWGLVEVAVTCVFFVLALPWGPVGIAMAWTASFWVLMIPAMWYAARPAAIPVKPMIEAIWKYIGASALAGYATAAIMRGLPLLEPMSWTSVGAVRVLQISVLFGILYLGVVVLLHRGISPLRQVVGLLREMMPARKDVRATPLAPTAVDASLPRTCVSQGTTSTPLVSILIPAFNSELWIADTLRSALQQTWEPKEIIVVDDGSTDRTLAIARQFESEMVRVVTQKNEGAAAARNKALSLSQGEYIQWLDADDLLAPDKIAKQMEVIGSCRSKWTLLSSAFGRFKYRYRRAAFVPTELWADLSPVEWLLNKLGKLVYMQTATWLISRELTEAAGLWDTTMLSDDDGEYFCRVLLASDGVRFVPESKVYYRAPWVGTLSYLGSSDMKLEAHWRSMQLHIKYLLSLEDSERARNACLAYLQGCLIYFYPDMPNLVHAAEETAKNLGGRLRPPTLPWKYSALKLLIGWRRVKSLQLFFPKVRWWMSKGWDHVLFSVEGSHLGRLVMKALAGADTVRRTAQKTHGAESDSEGALRAPKVSQSVE